ncbi:MAG TPA: helix-turn-helix domain-containing protein [Ktedonobacteraceae bacterium]|nr:helix-turn-helix domain-containing protein [Ktedonobacteraceae bacterium]
MTGRQVPDRAVALEGDAVRVSVRAAARILDVSESSVYGYLARGKLTRMRIDERIMLNEQEVQALKSQLPGRAREWVPPGRSPLYLTTIIVPVRPACGALLDKKLAEFRRWGKHQIVGTCSRAISCSLPSPERLMILLFWHDESLPPRQQRDQEIEALAADLSEVCAWEMALITEGQALGFQPSMSDLFC